MAVTVPATKGRMEALGKLGSVAIGRATQRAHAVQTLKLTGEFDMSNAGELARAISHAIDAGMRDFVVDLSDVSFLDANTLDALLLGRKQVASRNGEFALVCPPAMIWRLFVLTGLSAVFVTFASPEAALEYFSSARD